MICVKCGQEILSRARFCPVCGTTVNHNAGSSAGKNDISSEGGAEKALDTGAQPDVSGQGEATGAQPYAPAQAETTGAQPYAPAQADKPRRKNGLYNSSIALLLLGAVQFIFFNPLLTSGFSTWDQYAYMRGFPWYICAIVPYAMIVCDLLVVITGVVGIRLARVKRAARFYNISGVITSFVSAALLVVRIVHGHVAFKSVGFDSQGAVVISTAEMLQEQYLRSLYAVFILTAITAILSFCYIYFSFNAKYMPSFHTGKAMIFISILGLTGSLCGILFGSSAGIKVPLVATWTLFAFVVMLTVGIAGLSRRRSPFARIIWGLVQFSVFTFCMLQTIYYAYSAVLQGAFMQNGQFIWITALSAILATSTILSAYYAKR